MSSINSENFYRSEVQIVDSKGNNNIFSNDNEFAPITLGNVKSNEFKI